ncbi:DNA GLYCOSYLASE SUPERFAMILY PROTEIN [Salix koriyanagi]|uniref:DNA GLYCOSYLASE SUPERFAMILY PROTEIN n=1 Tax=Salix koriyanagi TaxID=2511006 RepID=A0A9Q0Q8J3_9ROSI|nr:DNA GLYCOSYLASE SUPERFAMILY PROTEIN [Salix koriyanagi]
MGEQSLLSIRGKLFRLILRLQTTSLERKRDVVLSLLIQILSMLLTMMKNGGVPVHDDKLLFELLVLTGAQVGSDWTSVLKKREAFREAFFRV